MVGYTIVNEEKKKHKKLGDIYIYYCIDRTTK